METLLLPTHRGYRFSGALPRSFAAMALSIRPIDPVNRAFFAGEVSGIDLRQTMTQGQVGEIVAGMDKYAVLVFHEQKIDDARQLAFSRNFGTLEIANADIRRDEEPRPPLRSQRGARTAPHHRRRRPPDLGAGGVRGSRTRPTGYRAPLQLSRAAVGQARP